MKKFLIFALSAVMLLSLAGCGLFGNKTPSEGGTETKTPKMVTLDANNKLKVELGLKKERFLPGEEIKLSFEISGLSDENDNMTAWLAMIESCFSSFKCRCVTLLISLRSQTPIAEKS